MLVGQSGGPTPVINASLAGILTAARAAGIPRVLGMRYGVQGLLEGALVDLLQQPPSFYEPLPTTPSAVLGSCRYRLRSDDVERILSTLRRENIRYFLYIGGNDSADTAHQVHLAAQADGYELAVIGVPKTIDNDLPCTDHCPGYGSAARFVAQTTAEAGLDTEAMRRTDPIKLIEVMGRHAGWLAAAAWLGKRDDRAAPHLVLLPERPQTVEAILAGIETVYRRIGHCVVVLNENQCDPAGRVLGTRGEPRWVDAFGHAYHDSPAVYLADEVRRRLGLRARVDKPGTIQRMSSAHQSTTDRLEAAMAGRAAVRLAIAGATDVMVTLVRESDEPYRCGTGLAPLGEVANHQRRLPPEFIAADGWGPSPTFERYARPLLGDPLPHYARLA